ncbi:hypothetical protein TNCV_4982551 [Trichonephila clavipes]|nr:hypothetical protein TNCV_4982551 [Trichonephila clavipes]
MAIQRDTCPANQASTIVMVDFSDNGGQSSGHGKNGFVTIDCRLLFKTFNGWGSSSLLTAYYSYNIHCGLPPTSQCRPKNPDVTNRLIIRHFLQQVNIPYITLLNLLIGLSVRSASSFS